MAWLRADDVAVDGTTSADVAAFRLDRPGRTDPSFVPSWMV